MNDLPYFDHAAKLRAEFQRLVDIRRAGRKSQARARLTREQRKLIHQKTAGKCHVCGRDVALAGFQADHVRSHASGGDSIIDNFLPACETCNNYRWHYLPDEFQWILKLGVWAKTEIANDTKLGKRLADVFIAKEQSREKRRRTPRT